MSSNNVIEIDNVSKCYEMYDKPSDRLKQFFVRNGKQYYKEFWALKNISFNVKEGEVVGILGRNGSGKSTLLQIIANTLQPTSGTVQTKGTLAALLELGSGFNPAFSGHDNIFLNGSILGLSNKQIEEKYDEIVAFADIGEHLFQPVNTYSSGMAVRLAFAVQACIDPQVLIVDEALSVGDEKFQRKCYNHIEKLKAKGCSILLVTHSTSTVEKFCDRGVLIHKGEMHSIGEAKNIVDQYHALLYTDEKEYYKRINAEKQKLTPVKKDVENSSVSNSNDINQEYTHRAEITDCRILDASLQPCDFFKTGEKLSIEIDIRVNEFIPELQAGILLRTVEGVSAFGTSTMYHNANYQEAAAGKYLKISFMLDLNLSPGTYFITCSLAEAISEGDMAYLDRKTDIMSIRVDQMKLAGSGIAYLPTQVTVKEF